MEQMITVSEAVVDIPINFRMSEADRHKVEAANKKDLTQVVTYLLQEYIKGGVLLEAQHCRYLSTVADEPIRTARDVLRVFENGIRRHSANGSLRVSYDVDPAFAEPLEQVAVAQSRTVDEIVQEAMAVVFTNSWLYAMDISGGTIHLTKEMRERLEKAMGQKMVTGADVVSWAENNKPTRWSTKAQKNEERQ